MGFVLERFKLDDALPAERVDEQVADGFEQRPAPDGGGAVSLQPEPRLLHEVLGVVMMMRQREGIAKPRLQQLAELGRVREAGFFKPIHCEAFAGHVAGSGGGTVICRKTMISSSVSGLVKRPISRPSGPSTSA